MRWWRWIAGMLTGAVAALGMVATPAYSGTYYLAVDVPAGLGGTDFGPNQIVRSDDAVYAPEAELPPGTEIAALHLRPEGLWLFSPSHAVTLGGATYEPRDIVTWDGVTYSAFLQGSAAGIPGYARIDALFLDTGAPVLSFDVPVDLGGTQYSPSDLVRYVGTGAFSLYWNAEAAGVPATTNVVGAARDGAGTLVVSFDVPTNLGGIEYLPGQLVRWSGSAFGSYFVDPSWPPYARLRDFTFAPAAGAIPDGAGVPGSPLTLASAGGNLTLTWGTSCRTGDSDYEIYEGILGSYYSHTAKLCSTGGATAWTFPLPSGSTYYLVVPRNARREGSYGRRSSGEEIPPPSGACLVQEVATVCP